MISVVVPYYNQPEQLLRTWEGLQRQGIPDLQVIVADDGSASPAPRLSPDVVHVRQPDLGFRAAAARNLGARAADGEVLAFLDADTVPEPGYLAALLPLTTPGVLTVGRRRHADQTGELPEPAWLADGYRETADLTEADGRSFRFVISAVMAMPAPLFRRLGGFDERYVGYGGEDWDLAYRAWNTGADLRHVPHAIAWHDGPDWAGRPHESKDAEERRLADLIPEPSIRRGRPGLVADVLLDTDPGPQTYADLAVGTEWSQDQLDRARFRISLGALPVPPTMIADLVTKMADEPRLRLLRKGSDIGTAVTTREHHRCERPPVDVEI